MKTNKEILEEYDQIFGKEHHTICEGLKCRCHKEVKAFITELLEVKDQQMKEIIVDHIKLANRIESEGPDGGTRQWMAFKRFRNTLADELNE